MLRKRKEEGHAKNKYNILIIGCGNQGCMSDIPGSNNEQKIISFAKAFKGHKNTNELIFYDIDIEKAKEAATIWDGIFTCDLELALKHADIVIIATTDNKHYELLKKSAEYDLKLVIVEKPICEDLEHAREIVALYKEKGIPLMLNYTRRFLPHYDYLEQYGKPVYATCAFNRGLIHSGSHSIDFFNMIGAENYRMIEIPTEAYRVWDLKIYYENHVFSEIRVGDMPVWDYYDNATVHLVENAYNFLKGKEELKCTGEDGLKALEICYELMGVK
ncbi:MAG: Gfo/Idh/MocA family oxidoreductase [Candidatus Lokiarchaeota archaeon]|nr:Gfo/Idh/MocA family oxidoreductase [Candidatus Lokiarchaeota archaeon]